MTRLAVNYFGLAILLTIPLVLAAFTPHTWSGRPVLRLNQFASPPPPPPQDNDPSNPQQPQGKGGGGYQPEEEFNLDEKGESVDWDAAWKKVVKEQQSQKKVDRPGEGYYKSEAEIAAIRAANTATEQMNRVANQIPSMPTWSSLQGDWKVRS